MEDQPLAQGGEEELAPQYRMSIPKATPLDMGRMYTSSGGPSILDYVSAKWDSALNTQSFVQMRRDYLASTEIRHAENDPDFQSYLMSNLDEVGWKDSPFFRQNIKFDKSLDVSQHMANAKMHDDRERAELLINDSPIGMRSVLGLGVDLAAGVLDPINWIPYTKAFTAGKALTLGGRAAMEGVEAATGAVIAHEASYAVREQQGEVFVPGQVGMEMLTSFMAGYGIRAGGGLFKEAASKAGDSVLALFGKRFQIIAGEASGAKIGEHMKAEYDTVKSNINEYLSNIGSKPYEHALPELTPEKMDLYWKMPNEEKLKVSDRDTPSFLRDYTPEERADFLNSDYARYMSLSEGERAKIAPEKIPVNPLEPDFIPPEHKVDFDTEPVSVHDQMTHEDVVTMDEILSSKEKLPDEKLSEEITKGLGNPVADGSTIDAGDPRLESVIAEAYKKDMVMDDIIKRCM